MEDIRVKLAELDKQIIVIDSMLDRIVPKLSRLKAEQTQLKWELSKLYAELYREFKAAGGKKTEKQVESEIYTFGDYQKLMEQYLEVQKELAIIESIYKRLQDKLKNVNMLIELYKAKYFGELVDITKLVELDREISDAIESVDNLEELLTK